MKIFKILMFVCGAIGIGLFITDICFCIAGNTFVAIRLLIAGYIFVVLVVIFGYFGFLFRRKKKELKEKSDKKED